MKLIYDSRQEKLRSRIKFAWRMVRGKNITLYTPDSVIEAGYAFLEDRGLLKEQLAKARHKQVVTHKPMTKKVDHKNKKKRKK